MELNKETIEKMKLKDWKSMTNEEIMIGLEYFERRSSWIWVGDEWCHKWQSMSINRLLEKLYGKIMPWVYQHEDGKYVEIKKTINFYKESVKTKSYRMYTYINDIYIDPYNITFITKDFEKWKEERKAKEKQEAIQKIVRMYIEDMRLKENKEKASVEERMIKKFLYDNQYIKHPLNTSVFISQDKPSLANIDFTKEGYKKLIKWWYQTTRILYPELWKETDGAWQFNDWLLIELAKLYWFWNPLSVTYNWRWGDFSVWYNREWKDWIENIDAWEGIDYDEMEVLVEFYSLLADVNYKNINTMWFIFVNEWMIMPDNERDYFFQFKKANKKNIEKEVEEKLMQQIEEILHIDWVEDLTFENWGLNIHTKPLYINKWVGWEKHTKDQLIGRYTIVLPLNGDISTIRINKPHLNERDIHVHVTNNYRFCAGTFNNAINTTAREYDFQTLLFYLHEFITHSGYYDGHGIVSPDRMFNVIAKERDALKKEWYPITRPLTWYSYNPDFVEHPKNKKSIDDKKEWWKLRRYQKYKDGWWNEDDD